MAIFVIWHCHNSDKKSPGKASLPDILINIEGVTKYTPCSFWQQGPSREQINRLITTAKEAKIDNRRETLIIDENIAGQKVAVDRYSAT